MMPPAAARRPGLLSGGVLATGLALLATLLEGYFWVDVYTDLLDLVPEDVVSGTEVDEAVGLYRNFLLITVIISAAMALITAGGAVAAHTGRNGGRIVVWSVGGVATAWHVCCSGYTLVMRALFTAAVAQANNEYPDNPQFDPADHFAMWKIDTAVIAGFAAGIVTLVAIVLIAQGSVNRYFRGLRDHNLAGYDYRMPPPHSPGW